MDTMRIFRLVLSGAAFCMGLALSGCATQPQTTWVSPYAPTGGGETAVRTVAGDGLGLHLYSDSASRQSPTAETTLTRADTDSAGIGR